MRIERLIIAVTYRCQCRCIHCSQAGYAVAASQELSASEVREIIDTASRYHLKEVNLFGGEALLRKDLFDLLRHARSKAEILSLDTNGIAVDEEVAAWLAETPVDVVYLSLHSAEPGRNETIYGRRGMFDAIERATARLVEAGVKVYYSMCVFKDLFDEQDMAQLVALAKRRGVSGIRVLYPMNSGLWAENRDALLSPEDRRRLEPFIDNQYVFVAEGMNQETFEGCGGVSGGTVFVSPYGEVQPCNFMPVLLGNVREEPLDVILLRALRHRFFTPEFQEGRCPMMTFELREILGNRVDPESRLASLGDFPVLDLDWGCNNGCVDCPSRGRSGQVSLSSLLERVADFRRNGYKTVWVRGGEPFLMPGLPEVLAAIRKEGLHAGVITNGRVFARPGVAQSARKQGLHEVMIPLWGEAASDYDAHVRVPGAFHQVLDGISRLSAAGVRTTVFGRNVHEDSPSLKAAAHAGADVVLVAPGEEFSCSLAHALGHMSFAGTRVVSSRGFGDEPRPRARNSPNRDLAVVVVPPLNVTAMAMGAYSNDPVANFPLASLKLASYYRGLGYRVEFVDLFREGRWGMHGEPLPENKVREAPVGMEGRGTRPIYRFGCTRDEIRSRFRKLPRDASVVAVSSIFTYSWESTWETIQEASAQFPDARIRLGGIYPTLCEEHARQSGAHEIVVGTEMDVARQWIDLDSWRKLGTTGMALKTSYGCHRNCTYCAVRRLEGTYVPFDRDDLFEQLEAYLAAGLREVHLWDSDVLADRAHFEAILDFLAKRRSGLKLQVPSGFALHGFDEELARRMRAAGFSRLIVPLETTSRVKLKEFHRVALADQVEGAIASARSAGFESQDIWTVLMMAYPGQTREQVLDDLAAVVRTETTIDLRVYTPIPSTRDFETYSPLIGGRPLEDLDSFLFPMAQGDLSVEFLEDVYQTFNVRQFTVAEILAGRQEHPLFEELARRLS